MAGTPAAPLGHDPVGVSFDAIHRDQVAQTLFQAASEVLAAEGPAALTVRRIAAVAGVSTMNVYSRFGSKDGIVEHLYIEGFSRLRETQDVGETDDPLDDLRRCGLAYRRFALDNPTYYSVMFGGAIPQFKPSDAALVHASGTLQLLADRVERAMQMGAIPPADPLHTAAAVWAACHGVVSLELADVGPPVVDWERVFATTSGALITGLASATQTQTLMPDRPRKTTRGRPTG